MIIEISSQAGNDKKSCHSHEGGNLL